MTTLFETVQILGVILVLLITTIRLNIYMVLPWPNLKRFLNKFNEFGLVVSGQLSQFIQKYRRHDF